MSTLTTSHALPVSDGLAVFFAWRDRSSAGRTPPRSSSRLAPGQALPLLSVPSVLSLSPAVFLSQTLSAARLSLLTIRLLRLSLMTVILVTRLSVVTVILVTRLSVITVILVTRLSIVTVILFVVTLFVRHSAGHSHRGLSSLVGVPPPLEDASPLCLQVCHENMRGARSSPHWHSPAQPSSSQGAAPEIG